MNDFNDFVAKLNNELNQYSFEKCSIDNTIDVEEIVVWKRSTWNTNRAILLIKLSEKNINEIKSLGEFSQKIKFNVGKQIGYKIFFYVLGLQIIYFGENIGELPKTIEGYVDKYDNQRVILQSIFVLDNTRKLKESIRTWGQVISSRYQDMIENTMRVFISNE